MTTTVRLSLLAGLALTAATLAAPVVAQAQQASMSFFVTSRGGPEGANFGGIEGADKHCQTLATEAGAGAKTWRAYLSTQAADGKPAVNAKDRIGAGPWANAKGVVVAKDVAELHTTGGNLIKSTALNEKGDVVNGRGDNPNTHDILTGTQMDGTAFPAGNDMTCGNWTKGGAEGAAMVGHSDRTGLDESVAAKSWNASHASRGGCSAAALKGTGGAGLLYCFATN